jgi:hypothetical protein
MMGCETAACLPRDVQTMRTRLSGHKTNGVGKEAVEYESTGLLLAERTRLCTLLTLCSTHAAK